MLQEVLNVFLSVFLYCSNSKLVSAVGTSTIGTIFLIVNAALGAGLLNFPQAFDQAGGVQVAMIVQSVLVLFIILSLISLAKSSDGNSSGTVQVTNI